MNNVASNSSKYLNKFYTENSNHKNFAQRSHLDLFLDSPQGLYSGFFLEYDVRSYSGISSRSSSSSITFQ